MALCNKCPRSTFLVGGIWHTNSAYKVMITVQMFAMPARWSFCLGVLTSKCFVCREGLRKRVLSAG